MKKLQYLGWIIVMAMILVACTVPEVVQRPDGSSVTNQVPDPRIGQAVATVGAINEATRQVNPYSGLVDIGLAATTGIATIWAAFATYFKNKNWRLFKTVVQGVEHTTTPEAKEAIAAHSGNVGNRLELDAAVQRVVSGNG